MARPGLREWLAAGRVIAGGNMLRYGDPNGYTARFEQRFGKHVGAKHVLAVQSGTGALTAALAAAGIGPGDEVIVPAYTWMATAAAPVSVGAVPVLADIDESLTIDPADIIAKITPHTRAIIPVHMVNAPCDMDAIMAIAREHNLIVIEDACQAVGIPYKDRFCGAIGDAGTYSFNAFKNMNIGEGGALTTNSEKLFARARNYHDLGTFVRGHEETYNEPTFIGSNMRVTEIDGAMLGVQLSKLGPALERNRKRRAAVAEVVAGGSGYRMSPHLDEAQAMTATILFDRTEDAARFGALPGAYCLSDNSKHVYTNWEPILSKRTFHPDMSPWKWAKREIEYTPDMCKRTLDILARTCRVELGGRAPIPLLKRRVRGMLAHALPSNPGTTNLVVHPTAAE